VFRLPCFLLAVSVVIAFHALGLIVTPAHAASLNVVVTLPVLKDWVQHIGGHHVTVTSIMTGYESEHTYSPKPSDLVAIRKAHVLIEVGAGLEVWVSPLVKNAGNAGLVTVTASKGIELLPDHEEVAPGHAGLQTHAHARGNPHVWLDPDGAAIMVRHIADALISIDPKHGEEYRANCAAYLGRLDAVAQDLRRASQQVPDHRIVVHHPAWPYFARYFGFTIAATLLTQPTAEPSARRIQAMIEKIKQNRIKVIVSEAQLNQKLPQLLARETGARVVLLTTLPGAVPGSETYLDMLRYNVIQLVEALSRVSGTDSPP
jgi:ABC-type Zn uptake system ZnuABC Zn-binding protein ZnuA